MAQDRTKVDLIYRQAAIDAASCECNELRGVFGRIEERLKALPSAEEESFEWCYTCKEYDQEKHCCHRWTKVIRNTVEELQSAQPERKAEKTLAEEVKRIKREITDIFAEQMDVQPSAQSKRMRGRWVKDEEASSQHSESIYVCSACNNMEAWGEVEKNTFKFCPNCGADMRGETCMSIRL